METMFFRVIALLLAVVLLWSGVNTAEAQAAPSRAAHDLRDATAALAAPEGSVAQHHLDELPAQTASDPSTESPAVLPARLALRPTSMALALPEAFASVGVAPPFLAGPLRPPCSTALAA